MAHKRKLILRRHFLKQLGWFTAGIWVAGSLRDSHAIQPEITNESTTVISAADRNWQNFWNHHLGDWHGTWTRYNPDGEVIESFRSTRSFKANPEITEVVQTNSYVYADGSTLERQWEYNKQANSLPDGFSHPASESMRGFCFEQGAAAWLLPKLNPGPSAIMELFLMHQNVRHSVGVIYDKNGDLMRTASIREDLDGFPSQYWSTQLSLVPERLIDGRWTGNVVAMKPDLSPSDRALAEFRWDWDNHRTYHYPDGITLSCPDKLQQDTPFVVAINWLVDETNMQRMLVMFDETGIFSDVALILFRRTDDFGITQL